MVAIKKKRLSSSMSVWCDLVHIVECVVSLLKAVLRRAVRPRPLWRRGVGCRGDDLALAFLANRAR